VHGAPSTVASATVFVIAAVGPEAQASPGEFERMVRFAIQRMEKLSDEGE